MKFLECRSPSANYLLIPIENIAYISQTQERWERPTQIFLKNHIISEFLPPYIEVIESVEEIKAKIGIPSE